MSRRSLRCDKSANSRATDLLNTIDEYTREFLAIVANHSIDASDTVTELEQTVIDRGRAPELIRGDNFSEHTAHALTDWCTASHASKHYIDSGSLRQSTWIEPRNARLRYDCRGVEELTSFLEAHIIVPSWRRDYNDYRHRSALGMLTPIEFVA